MQLSRWGLGLGPSKVFPYERPMIIHIVNEPKTTGSHPYAKYEVFSIKLVVPKTTPYKDWHTTDNSWFYGLLGIYAKRVKNKDLRFVWMDASVVAHVVVVGVVVVVVVRVGACVGVVVSPAPDGEPPLVRALCPLWVFVPSSLLKT